MVVKSVIIYVEKNFFNKLHICYTFNWLENCERLFRPTADVKHCHRDAMFIDVEKEKKNTDKLIGRQTHNLYINYV